MRAVKEKPKNTDNLRVLESRQNATHILCIIQQPLMQTKGIPDIVCLPYTIQTDFDVLEIIERIRNAPQFAEKLNNLLPRNTGGRPFLRIVAKEQTACPPKNREATKIRCYHTMGVR